MHEVSDPFSGDGRNEEGAGSPESHLLYRGQRFGPKAVGFCDNNQPGLLE
jgi:hypothetical protein